MTSLLYFQEGLVPRGAHVWYSGVRTCMWGLLCASPNLWFLTPTTP